MNISIHDMARETKELTSGISENRLIFTSLQYQSRTINFSSVKFKEPLFGGGGGGGGGAKGKTNHTANINHYPSQAAFVPSLVLPQQSVLCVTLRNLTADQPKCTQVVTLNTAAHNGSQTFMCFANNFATG